MKANPVLSICLCLALRSLAEYIWPSPYDELEDILSLQSGYFHRGFIDAVNPCSFGTRVQGRQNAAEWIRSAYHDMATHDAAAGTGGLDASIVFELDRAENPGRAFNNTFGFFNAFYSVRASAADLLALGVVAATSMCLGPGILFRAGRLDATGPGPAGVPQPQTDLQATRDAFARAGFGDDRDMITMVACGHTLGGIHSADFPDLTGGGAADPNNDTVSHFDGSFDAFDNAVVTDYLNGSSTNLLVVGANDTLNSDKRVFAADGNQTVSSLADRALFASACADIFARMVDTVPSAVQLSEPIAATDIKPYISTLALEGNDTLTFAGQVRVRTTTGSGRQPDDLAVHLTLVDRTGAPSSTIVNTTRPTFQLGMTTGLQGENFVWFEFSTALRPESGIGGFLIHVTAPSTGATTVYDNAGTGGYPVDDRLLYQQSQSCLNTTLVDGKMALRVVALAREEEGSEASGAGGPPTLALVRRVGRQGVVVPRLDVERVVFGDDQAYKWISTDAGKVLRGSIPKRLPTLYVMPSGTRAKVLAAAKDFEASRDSQTAQSFVTKDNEPGDVGIQGVTAIDGAIPLDTFRSSIIRTVTVQTNKNNKTFFTIKNGKVSRTASKPDQAALAGFCA